MMPVLRKNGTTRDFPSLFFDASPLEDFARTINRVSGGEVSAGFLNADIVEFPDRYELHFDVPGLSRDNIELSIEDKVLTVKVERQKIEAGENGTVRHNTRWHGSMTRQFALPPVASEVTAGLENGVLTISLEKQPEKQSRKIEIN